MNKEQIASHIKAWVERSPGVPNMCSEVAQEDLAEYLWENLASGSRALPESIPQPKSLDPEGS